MSKRRPLPICGVAFVSFVAMLRAAFAQGTLPEVEVSAERSTPLRSDASADSASRLGLTVRETPASVEVIDREAIRTRGLRSVSEAAQGAVGVTAGDSPAQPANFSMRGFTNSQLNTLYNGIKIGPPNMTSRVMDTGNLERIEILKGSASLMSGEGASGGSLNFVIRKPHAGAIENEAYFSLASFGGMRASIGSGGSTTLNGLDYRFDLSRSSSNGFIDDTRSESWHLSAALDYRVSAAVRLFGAFEYKKDHAKSYWGTPLVSAQAAGGNSADGIVSGTHISNFNGTNLGAVTIDSRTLRTNYNVLDNRMKADEVWWRGGFEWSVVSGVVLRSQLYRYSASREWFNNEVIAFNAGTGLIDRERFFVAHDQVLLGNKTELQWDSRLFGMDNRMVLALEASKLDFVRPGAANFPGDSVNLLAPMRGDYGVLTTQQQTSRIDNVAVAFEDRLRINPALAVVGGLRIEEIALDRTSVNAAGVNRAGFPFSRTWRPTTGRVGFTWEAVPGFSWFGQYATGADVAANNLFLLGGLQPPELTRSRTYETGVRHLFWQRRGEWSMAAFDIARSNVYSAVGGRALNLAGKQVANGVEVALGLRPTRRWNMWGNFAYTRARYRSYDFAGGSFTGNTPPNVPTVVANAGASYRFEAGLPIEAGTSVRHVGDRFSADANTVKLLAYTTADAFVSAELRKTRLTLRVRNLANKRYAIWGDPFYPDQILLGAPRSLEVSVAFKL